MVSVNSQYDSGLYFMANSRSFLFDVVGRAEDVRDLCILRRGAGTLDGWPKPFVWGLSRSTLGGRGFGGGNCVSSRSLSMSTILPSEKRAMKVFSDLGIHFICWTGEELMAP